MQTLRTVFRIAAVYNIAWGVAVVFFPNLFFDIFGLPHINYFSAPRSAANPVSFTT